MICEYHIPSRRVGKTAMYVSHPVEYQRGFDDYVAVYVARDGRPAPTDCPGLALPMASDERRSYMRGWLAARDEE